MKETNIAAVCGFEVRIYGETERNGRRPLLEVRVFAHHGAAVLFAQEYEESQRTRKPR